MFKKLFLIIFLFNFLQNFFLKNIFDQCEGNLNINTFSDIFEQDKLMKLKLTIRKWQK